MATHVSKPKPKPRRKNINEKGEWQPPGGATPYRRPLRPGPDPTPAGIREALKNCFDLGECGRALKAAFPEWTEAERLAALRRYVINLQLKWLDSEPRKERRVLADEANQAFQQQQQRNAFGFELDGEEEC